MQWPACTRLVLSTLFLIALAVVATQPAHAQTFQVLHNFTGGEDGAEPNAGVTLDPAGNLYGTASAGGFGGNVACVENGGCGTVYQLKKAGSGWTFNTLYSFNGGGDGYFPAASVIFGPDGSLYSTTVGGGASNNCFSSGCGTVFKLQPPATACKTSACPWQKALLYSFQSGTDGANPYLAGVIFDTAGNIYGTTFEGGFSNWGTVYELARSDSGWTESVLYAFGLAISDGIGPASGVVFDSAGNLYSTTPSGGLGGNGTVFQLARSGSGWKKDTLYNFQNGSDGASPFPGLIFDPLGNLYGATGSGGSGGSGTVFKLTPANGNWTFSLVYTFAGGADCGPVRSLVMDGAGNLYGTTVCDGANGIGNVFELTPSGGSWTYKDLHDFAVSDGAYPFSNVVIDAQGNVYGTASEAGADGGGVVWEITP